MKRPVVVISAVNINEGGPLSILQDAVQEFLRYYQNTCRFVLLVHNKELFKDVMHCKQVELLEYRYPKKSWLFRIWFEYVECYFLSRKLNADILFALNDITPNFIAKTKVVYCQNPAPFYKLDNNASKQKKLYFFHFFYNIFYNINLKKNKYVFVQQQWLRDEFIKKFKIENVVVAHPDVVQPKLKPNAESNKTFVFFYPALPRVSKNFEILFRAVQQLQQQHNNFELILTFNGEENSYASFLVQQYKHLPNVKFVGTKDRTTIWQMYQQSSCLVFPSKMETWGLPITEMKTFGKPILVADCRYAAETVGDYSKACFFDPDNADELAKLMANAIQQNLQYHSINFQKPAQPFVQSWKELFDLVLSDNT